MGYRDEMLEVRQLLSTIIQVSGCESHYTSKLNLQVNVNVALCESYIVEIYCRCSVECKLYPVKRLTIEYI